MVRVWAPAIIPALDDLRLAAQHAETHYILNALARGLGHWWLHPETQHWYGREQELRTVHDRCAELMTAAGMNHRSETPGPRSPTTEPPHGERWEQDLADLYRKWAKEGRVVREGPHIVRVLLGRPTLKPTRPGDPHLGEFKSGKKVYGYQSLSGARQMKASTMAQLGEHFASTTRPHRDWSKEDSAGLKALVLAEDRGPTLDLTEAETRLLMPKSWSQEQIEAVLLEANRRREAAQP
jgi:hypothetical protein